MKFPPKSNNENLRIMRLECKFENIMKFCLMRINSIKRSSSLKLIGREMGVCKFVVDLERRQREQWVCVRACVHVCVCLFVYSGAKTGWGSKQFGWIWIWAACCVALRCVCLPVNRLTLTFKINWLKTYVTIAVVVVVAVLAQASSTCLVMLLMSRGQVQCRLKALSNKSIFFIISTGDWQHAACGRQRGQLAAGLQAFLRLS